MADPVRSEGRIDLRRHEDGSMSVLVNLLVPPDLTPRVRPALLALSRTLDGESFGGVIVTPKVT